MKQLFLILFLTVLFALSSAGQAQDVNFGETWLVDNSWFFTQQNSTVGKTIIRDADGGVHLTWTHGTNVQVEGRLVRYTFADDEIGAIGAQLAEHKVDVDPRERSGYASLDLMPIPGSYTAIVFYHIFGQLAMAWDWNRGVGAFSTAYIAGPNRQVPLVAKGTIDRNGIAHVISGTHNMGEDAVFPLIIWHAEPNEDYSDWEVTNPRTVEQTFGLSHHIKASRESDKVSLVWHHNIVGVPAPEGWENTVAYGMNNDLYLIESEEGLDWDLEHPFNITRTIPADHEREGVLAYGDTLRPYNDCDILYVGDVVHVVFSVRGFTADPEQNEVPPVLRLTTRESQIWHWDSESDSLTLVADGWYENAGDPTSLHSNVSRPSLGVDAEGTMYCLFRQVTEDDRTPEDYCYGELMLSKSGDDGIVWSEAINLTGTVAEDDHNPDEYVDECHPCLAELVDDDLHILYAQASEGFEPPQNILVNVCRIVYQRIPVADLPDVDDLPMPRENFTYHVYPPVGVESDPQVQLPTASSIQGIYPNPFNDRAELSYDLSKSGQVRLAVFSAEGVVLIERDLGIQNSGHQTISISAAELPAGIYFAQLNFPDRIQVRKLVCLK